MENVKFSFAQKIAGQERKAVMAVVAEALGGDVRYTGAPGFAYEACGWFADRDGVLHSPELTVFDPSIPTVLAALDAAGLTAEGKMTLVVKTTLTEQMFVNLQNLIASKAALLQKALDIEEKPSVKAGEGEVVFPFWNATLDMDKIRTYLTLAWRLCEQANTLKRVSPKEKQVENEKYAFRCFLLRLGFIGQAYKTERKILTQNLSGNGAFKNGTPREAGVTEDE
jgi:hypothetical protein